MLYRFVDNFRAGPKFVKLVHVVGFIIKKFVTMHGHMNVKFAYIFSSPRILYYIFIYSEKRTRSSDARQRALQYHPSVEHKFLYESLSRVLMSEIMRLTEM
jgi:hypothetical protein